MTQDLLWRGMLVGILAAFLATGFARTFAEPQIDRAIAYEAAHAPHVSGDHDEGPELVSRAIQKGVGLLTAMTLYGAAIGGIFSLVFAYAYGRLARIGPRSLAIMLAALAFLLIAIVPALKYPPTPPAVGNHETVGLRTVAYFAMLAISIVSAILAVKTRKAVLPSLGPFNATLIACVCYAIAVGIAQLALPIIDEVPADFPASVLWSFRVSAFGIQAILWTTIGLVFGALADRVVRPKK